MTKPFNIPCKLRVQRITGAILSIAAACLATAAARAAATFKESGGIVVIEAEHFDSRATATDNNHQYKIVPYELTADELAAAAGQFKNARNGSYMTAWPDSGENRNTHDLQIVGPHVDYKVQITTTGEYQLYVRGMGWDGASDSFYASIVEMQPASGGPGPDYYRYAPNPDTADFSAILNLPFDATTTAGWTGNGNPEVNDGGDASNDAPVVWTISKAGTYTIRIQQREDGNGVDALILQLSSLPVPGNPGPAESALVAGLLFGTQPSSKVTVPGATATFTVSVVTPAGAAVTYQWQQQAPGAAAFTDITGATGASYTTPTVTDAMGGTQYRVVATSGGASLTSAAATLITDATPPSVVGAFGGTTNVTIRFTEKLDKASAETAANYTVTGLTLSNPKLQANGTDVVLTTTAQTSGTAYALTINGVKDLAGNAISNGQAHFAGATRTVGGLRTDLWFGIVSAGTPAVSELTADPRYPNTPDQTVFWPNFGPFAAGNNYGDNYGAQISGWIVPPATGNYKFYLRSDDASQLFLSTDNTAANEAMICEQTGCCNAFTDAEGTLSSVPVTLTAGKEYWVRALLKEGGGDDYLQVGWRTPNDSNLNAPPTEVIGGQYLKTIADASATITFTQQPTNLTVGASSAVSFNVTFTAFSAFGTNAAIQWQKAPSGSSTFTNIAGANSTSYGFAFAEPADSGAQYRAVVTAAGQSASSSAATLTVSTDTVPPSLVSVNGDLKTVTVAFSEPIDPTSGAAKANYTLDGGAVVSSATLVTTTLQAGLVKLNVSGLTAGQLYTLTVSGVKDLTGNAVAAGTARSFTAYNISENFNDGQVPAGAVIAGTVSFPADGSIQLTPNVGNSGGSIIWADPLNGGTANKLTATFKLFIGNGSGNAADGFSFNVGSDIMADPTAPPIFGEDGAGSQLRVSFDTYDNGGGEAPAISVFWNGVETTIKTNLAKATMVNDKWVDVAIQVTADGKITLQHNNVKYFDQVLIDGWAPIATPQVGLGARTGGEYETHRVDDLNVLFNADVVLPTPPTITLISPTNATTYAVGANITATVNVAAPGSAVTKVTYYANGAKLADVTTAPYSLTVPSVAAGDYTIYATVTAANGLAVQSQSTRIIVGELPSKILLVTADPGPLTFAGDQAILAHLQGRGLAVDLSTGTALASDGSAAQGHGLVIISSSLGSGTVADKLRNAPLPVLDWESALEDNFGFQADDATKGTTDNMTDINIVDATSPLAAGLSAGTHTMLTAAETMSWGTPLGQAHIVATMTDDPTHANLFYYEKGATGYNGFVMPARRVFFFWQDNTARSANADAWKLFDAAVDWLRPVSVAQSVLSVARSTGTSLTISWTNGGTLQSNDNLGNASGWTDVTTASPATITSDKAHVFYRVKH